jgi:hypothetical protein
MANSIWQATAQTATGAIIPGAEVTVVDEVTGLNATIYSTLGGTALANPFFANSEGFIQFYAAAGTYRVTAEDTGTAQSITWRYIRFGDAASRDTGILTGQLPTADEINMVGATKNFTSNNLNPNVFGGAGDDFVAIGESVNATTAVFFLPINLINPPTSITVVGTFNVVTASGSAIYGGSVSVSLDSESGNKLASINIASATGMGAGGDAVYLKQASVGSTITVNV